VNNVGTANFTGFFESQPDEDVNNTIIVNAMSTVFMTKILISGLL